MHQFVRKVSTTLTTDLREKAVWQESVSMQSCVDKCPTVSHHGIRSDTDHTSPCSRTSCSSTSDELKTPMTPGQSPSSPSLEKSSVGLHDEQTRDSEQETQIVLEQSMSQVKEPTTLCMCPAKPKIPRPQNAFILYRRWRQQPMSAQYPNESNPQISVRIGREWTRELSEDQKEVWRQRAEEEKARHHREYPGYRYQPKRRVNHPSVLDLGAIPSSDWLRCENCQRSVKPPIGLPRRAPIKPASLNTPSATIERVELALRQKRPSSSDVHTMRSEPLQVHVSQGGLMSPSTDPKRRRLDHGSRNASDGITRLEHSSKIASSRSLFSTSTHQAGMRSHSDGKYGTEPMLPPIRSPAQIPMAISSLSSLPPSGFSQGLRDPVEMNGHSTSLILPPIQNSQRLQPAPERGDAPQAFLSKIDTLRNITRPTAVSANCQRGPLIAIEGEDAQTVIELGIWLRRKLRMEDGLDVKVIESPKLTISSDKKVLMAQYHFLVASWLQNSECIMDSLRFTSARTTAAMNPGQEPDASHQALPVALVANYSLHATDLFCKNFPLSPDDTYKPYDHWMWAASQWRGVCSPDLIIYICDPRLRSGGHAAAVNTSQRDNLFVVDLALTSGEELRADLDTHALRRLQFEVREWLRAFHAETGR